MSQKGESTFSRLLHSKVSPAVYIEKTNNPFRRGMPDFYYEATGPILWAEHKHILRPWYTNKLPGAICVSSSWPAQRRWLVRAHGNNKKTVVIVGIGIGKATQGYILTFPFNFEVERNQALSLEQIANYIENEVTNETTVFNV